MDFFSAFPAWLLYSHLSKQIWAQETQFAVSLSKFWKTDRDWVLFKFIFHKTACLSWKEENKLEENEKRINLNLPGFQLKA